ncbi:MAG: tetratricopeptide repeat protein, partial [Eubacterium sp.]|nr:tetratricopeptide repeat protein [Eubacterium sp.]
MGGIGKTHICKKLFEEYVNKHKKEGDECFQHIGYIVYDGDMDSSLQKCLKFKKQDNPEQNLEAAWKELKYLASDGRLLLFVDNVNVPIGSDPGLKKLKQIPGAMVLTSRRVSFSKEFEPYRIEFLSLDQCRQIYEEIFFSNTGGRIKEEDVPDLEYIIDKLAARHTLTVEFLARFNSIKLWTVKKLRNELEKNGFELEFRDDQDEEEAEKLVNIQKSYEVLYDMSMLTDAEKNILEAFSVFPYIPLKIEICNQWLLEDAGVSEDDDTLIGLFRKGWLQYDAEQRSFALHPVFAQFIYAKCEPKAERHSGMVCRCSKSLEIPESGSPFVCQQYLPYAESIENKLNMEEDDRQIIFLDSIAYLMHYICEYKKAERLYEKSLRISERVLGEEHPDTATSYNNLAFVYESQGEYRKAEELYKKSLGIRERVLGKEHPSTAINYNNLAGVYMRQGKYRKAEELYEKSLRISERVLGEEHSFTGTSYNNLAEVYENQGEYRKAEELYEKSLRVRERVLGKEHPDTAESYNNLAGVYESQGEYGKAEELYEKSLRIRERVLGEEHPDTAASYNNLAGVYGSMGEYGKAEVLYEKSLRISERVLGKEHPSTATSYNNLAVVYMKQREYRKAEELCEKSLRIREQVLGKEHLSTAESYNNLAGVYESQGEYGKAEELYEKSLRVRERVLGKEHPSTATSYNNLAVVYTSQGKYK